MPSSESTVSHPLHVAIIGCGVAGLALAIGLQARGVSFTVYERALGLREIGAGVGLSPNAERAMTLIDPAMRMAFKRVANPNAEDYFQWIDGHGSDELIYRLFLGKDCFQGCRRSDLLEEFISMLDQKNVKFSKLLESLQETASGQVRMTFVDGSVEMADAVVGCDGIHSKVREQILGPDFAALYTSQVCFRALIPMDAASASVARHRTITRFMYNGPNAHIITYPVAMDTLLNVLIVTADHKPWVSKDGRHTAQGNKGEVIGLFSSWHPTAKAIVELLPEELDKWAVFDMFERPASSYAMGSICLAGDAAHAAGPHLGSGAGFGIEDALVLSTVLAAAGESISCDTAQNRSKAVRTAFEAYNDVRYQRTQWLVANTRDAVDLFQWRMDTVGNDPEKFAGEITWRFERIWGHDVDGMAKEARERFVSRMECDS